MSNIFDDLHNWADSRGISQAEPSNRVYIANILEELHELIGDLYPRTEAEALAVALTRPMIGLTDKVTEHDEIDAIGDGLVYGITELIKRGYSPEKVLREIYKEINSRTGSMIDGKFVKDEVQKNRYAADFTDCKLKDN